MIFDWDTFLLEVLNFFVLLWILRRFLYQPILGVIEARQQTIDALLEDAHQRQAEADAARQTFEARLAHWEQEKAQARHDLTQEIAAVRQRRLAGVEQEAKEARARLRARAEQERLESQRLGEQQALALGGRFVGRLLGRVASPELERRLIAAMLADLSGLPPGDIERVRAALRDDGLEIISAFPLPIQARDELIAALSQRLGELPPPVFRENPDLLAGLRLHAGSWVLAANLRDELKFFRDSEPAESPAPDGA